MENDLWGKNRKTIEDEISITLDLFTENYTLKELDCGEFANISIFNMNYEVKSYDVIGVGHLLIMNSKESKDLQMVSIVLTPYYKNIPMLSSDFMYIKEKRNFLVEIYDLVDEKDQVYEDYIQKFQSLKDTMQLPDMPLKECWYDSIRSVCTAKITTQDKDKEIISFLEENLKLYINMELSYERLDREERTQKWKLTQEYVDNLINNGGASTNMFISALGADKTKTFFDTVFFGVASSIVS